MPLCTVIAVCLVLWCSLFSANARRNLAALNSLFDNYAPLAQLDEQETFSRGENSNESGTLQCPKPIHDSKPRKLENCPGNLVSQDTPSKNPFVKTRRSDSGGSYQCQECDATFMYPSKLTIHQRVHSTDRPYLCTLCPRTYKSKAELQRHIDRKHLHKASLRTKTSSECLSCNKKFTCWDGLSNHIRYVHQKKGQNLCEHCGMLFPSNRGLHRHIRTRHYQKEMQLDTTKFTQPMVIHENHVPREQN